MPIKFTSDKTTLLSLINPAISAVSAKSTLPALKGLLFSLENDRLTVCGYDLEKGVKVKADVFGREDGEIIVDAQKISAIIKNFQDCSIKFEADDKYCIKIFGGMSEFVIGGLKSDAFPNLPELGGDRRFKIDQMLFKEIINSTNFAVSQIDARPILMGELFKIEGKRLTVAALDNFRMAVREEDNAVFGNSSNFSFVVPGTALLDFSRFLTESEEMAEIEFTNKHIIMRVENSVFFSRLLEGEFPDYNKVIPTQSKIFVKLNRNEFLESTARAAILMDEKQKAPLKCEFSGNVLNISCKTQYGTTLDSVNTEKDGEDITIAFNNRYLLDAIKACKEETVAVALSSPHMIMVLSPEEQKEGSKYMYYVLPCNIKE